jgi:DNA-binding transcriptional LysR family regulator
MQPLSSRELRDQIQKRARLDELGVLVEVAEAGGLSAAAKKLRVPKSTIGRAIRRLEDDLGVALVRRMSHGPALTESGRVLADMAAPHIAALRDVPAALGRSASEAYGVLRITTMPDLASLVLAPLLPGFLARHPRVRPEMVFTRRTVDLAREGFDVAIRASVSGQLKSSALVAKKLGPNNIGLYASTQYASRRELPRRPEDLPAHDHILFFSGSTYEYHLRGTKGSVKVEVPARLNGDDFFFVREAVATGLGIGAMPCFMATQELAAGRFVRVLPEYQYALGAMYVMYPGGKPIPAKISAFTEYLRKHAPRLL